MALKCSHDRSGKCHFPGQSGDIDCSMEGKDYRGCFFLTELPPGFQPGGGRLHATLDGGRSWTSSRSGATNRACSAIHWYSYPIWVPVYIVMFALMLANFMVGVILTMDSTSKFFLNAWPLFPLLCLSALFLEFIVIWWEPEAWPGEDRHPYLRPESLSDFFSFYCIIVSLNANVNLWWPVASALSLIFSGAMTFCFRRIVERLRGRRYRYWRETVVGSLLQDLAERRNIKLEEKRDVKGLIEHPKNLVEQRKQGEEVGEPPSTGEMDQADTHMAAVLFFPDKQHAMEFIGMIPRETVSKIKDRLIDTAPTDRGRYGVKFEGHFKGAEVVRFIDDAKRCGSGDKSTWAISNPLIAQVLGQSR